MGLPPHSEKLCQRASASLASMSTKLSPRNRHETRPAPGIHRKRSCSCTNSGGGGSADGSGGFGAKGGTSATGGVVCDRRYGKRGQQRHGGQDRFGRQLGRHDWRGHRRLVRDRRYGKRGQQRHRGRAGSGGSSGGTTGAATGGNTSYGGMTGNGGATGTGGVVGTGGSSVSDAGSADVSAPEVANDLNRPPTPRPRRRRYHASPDANVYKPCPTNGDPCRILPFGDSITWGVDDEGNAGYRGPLFALTVAAHQKITFTGSLSNGPTTVQASLFPSTTRGTRAGRSIPATAATVLAAYRAWCRRQPSTRCRTSCF